ncbi:uncharacterized protein BO72DRAFT_452292 [Aspergillus fijiensis CBS 313.89]|uniref:Uncharacterized protein n=1 Tax=Aspergillus fijiensis CBS 313.89 TaxID=1448319 RepID=A0A8G1RGA2_9EURO|nr:uncharacterized protein BO72DRAFT_452292 [Aspergillus fijiensis CBS 313.89]RAK72800.1 hypothetical protein BO72DRAFT_452292 [Aspergillus fijiensis CBS 313.89]
MVPVHAAGILFLFSPTERICHPFCCINCRRTRRNGRKGKGLPASASTGQPIVLLCGCLWVSCCLDRHLPRIKPLGDQNQDPMEDSVMDSILGLPKQQSKSPDSLKQG